MPTVIDALVVQLGLDPSNFKKGQQQAKKSLVEMSDDTKKASGIITKSLQEVGRQVAVLFLGFESAVGFLRMLGSVNKATADLGRTATNLNMSAHELNQWGNAAELAGGKAEDIYGVFQTLSQSITEFQVSMTRSPLLALLSMLHIDWMKDVTHARKYTDTLEDLRKKLQQFSPEVRANLLTSAGVPGLTNLAQLSSAEFKQRMDDANQWNAVNEESIRIAKQLQMEWRKVGMAERASLQEFLAGFGDYNQDLIAGWNGAIDEFSRGFEALAPLTKQLHDILQALFSGDEKGAYEGGKNLATNFWHGIRDSLKDGFLGDIVKNFSNETGLTEGINTWSDFLGGLYHHFTGDATYGPMITAAEQKYGIPKNLLQRVAYDESGFNPDVISGKTRGAVGEIGIMQLRPEFFPGAGQSPQADIEMGAKHLADLHRQFAVEDWGPALAAYNDGAGNVRSSLAGGLNAHKMPKNVSDRVTGELAFAQLPRSDAIASAAWAATRGIGATPSLLARPAASSVITNNSSTQIDMTVNTQATDAAGIAAELPRAIKRKGLALQTDSGMN